MQQDIKAFVQQNKENILRDIKRLVDIKSVQTEAVPGAPYGEGVRRVQEEAMAMCREMGLAVTDHEGKIAYAHLGNEERFIGVIAHLDVVPEGEGWDTDPYNCTLRDGYLVGRGVLDDKGAFVLSAWAVKYLLDNNIPLNYGVRLIMGLNEETGMADVDYYNAACKTPVFTFTPDSDFPVGHGEKGIYSADLVSGPIEGGCIVTLEGGVASNVVADRARARIDVQDKASVMWKALVKDDIRVTEEDGLLLVEAEGKAGHAGMPHGAINANRVLLSFLLECGVLNEAESHAAAFMCRVMERFDGSTIGIAGGDGLFTPLTIIGGLLSKREDRLVLNVNSRYTTAITGEEMERRINAVCEENGFHTENVRNSEPFYLDPAACPAVNIMCDIYNEITGANEKPYVMSGGTYARHMYNAVSYGIEFPGDEHPDWVGNVHMKNEALKVDRALQTCEIFINTLIRLQDVRF